MFNTVIVVVKWVFFHRRMHHFEITLMLLCYLTWVNLWCKSRRFAYILAWLLTILRYHLSVFCSFEFNDVAIYLRGYARFLIRVTERVELFMCYLLRVLSLQSDITSQRYGLSIIIFWTLKNLCIYLLFSQWIQMALNAVPFMSFFFPVFYKLFNHHFPEIISTVKCMSSF